MTSSIANNAKAFTPRTLSNLPITDFERTDILYGSALLKPDGSFFQCPGDITFSTDGVTLTTTGAGPAAQALVKDGGITPIKLNIPGGIANEDVIYYDAGTGAWVIGQPSWSDMRMKTDIQAADLDYCEYVVRSTDMFSFDWLDEARRKVPIKAGFIAQQLIGVSPDSVRMASGVDNTKQRGKRKCILKHGSVHICGQDLDDGVYQFAASEKQQDLRREHFYICKNTIISTDHIDPAELGRWVDINGIYRDDMLQIRKDVMNQYLFGAVKNLMNKVDTLTARIEELEGK
tara:strand:+ start:99 stop:965 length:867 start_codon:yes stop_codon:yes gene_type:complete